MANVIEVWDDLEGSSDSELDMAEGEFEVEEGEFEVETSDDDTQPRPSTSTHSRCTARHVEYDWEEIRDGKYI